MRWGPHHFIFRGAPFVAYEEIGRLSDESEALRDKTLQLELELKKEAEEHQTLIRKMAELQQKKLQEASGMAIKFGRGIAKIEG